MRDPPTRTRELSSKDAARLRMRTLFEDLYAECFRGVYRYALARVGDEQTAQDVTSETFYRAWRRWPPRTIAGSPLKAWLFSIVRNLVIDHYRARGRYVRVSLDQADVSSQQDDPGQEDRLRLMAAREALLSLPARDQDVLSLRLAGLSNREIASVLETSEAAAGMACLRALRRLRDRLEE